MVDGLLKHLHVQGIFYLDKKRHSAILVIFFVLATFTNVSKLANVILQRLTNNLTIIQ
jgi:hypothetical protein